MRTHRLIESWGINEEPPIIPQLNKNKELVNAAIDLFNQWQLEGCPDDGTKERVVERVQYARQNINETWTCRGFSTDLNIIEYYLNK